MKRYHITFTTSTFADDPDEAISIAIDQIADGSAHMEVEEEEIESTEQQPFEDRKLNMKLAVLFMDMETADDPDAVRMEIIKAVADAGKDPQYVIDWLVNLGKER